MRVWLADNAPAPDVASAPSYRGARTCNVQDFTSQWYSNVGVAIVATVAIQVITMHGRPIFNSYIRFPLRRVCCKNRAVTQRDLVHHGCPRAA